MFNAVNKIIICAVAVVAASSCNQDNNGKEAEHLLDEIEQAVSCGDNQKAIMLMDSLDKTYPDQIEQRKRSLKHRPVIMEKIVIDRIREADSIIVSLQNEIDRIKGDFRHIDGGDLDGYYIWDKAYDPKFINSTGIEGRVSDDQYYFYIVAQSTGKKIGLDQVVLNTDADSCHSRKIPDGNGRMMIVEGAEMASFIPEEVYDLGEWAYNNADDIKSATLIGASGTIELPLKPLRGAAIGKAWYYSSLMQQHRSALINREKLERQLQIARDQIANSLSD